MQIVKIVIMMIGCALMLSACAEYDQAEDMDIRAQSSIPNPINGTVSEIISDCAFDGICGYVVSSENGDDVAVIWAEGMSLNCSNDMFGDNSRDIVFGDTIEAYGRITDEAQITTCGDDDYYIKLIE